MTPELTAKQQAMVDAIVPLERYLARHPEHKKKNGGSNCVALPFTCHYCKRERCDLELIDGDGYPVCVECIDGFAAILQG